MKDHKDRFRQLATAHFLGTLTDQETGELEKILAQGPEAREQFRQWAHLDAVLQEAATRESDEEKTDTPVHKVAWHQFAIGLSAMLVGGIFVAVFLKQNDQADIETAQKEAPLWPLADNDEGIAVLARVVDADWSGGQEITTGTNLRPGQIKLASGLVQIDFHSGASLIARGPLDLELEDAMNAHCQAGELRVFVPPSAKGFRLRTPDGEVIDYGTEFGLTVRDATSSVEVIEGEVAWIDENQPAPGKKLLAGKSIGNKQNYPSRAEFDQRESQQAQAAHQRWQKGLAELQKDPTLRLLYHFDKPNTRSIANTVQNAPPETKAAPVGATWENGHLPGLHALEFKQIGERIRLVEPRPYSALTMMMWVRIDGFDHKAGSFFHSDGSTPGGAHWLFVENGRIVLAILTDEGLQRIKSPSESVGLTDLGRWIHLAATVDPKASTMTLFKNGHPIATRKEVPKNLPISLAVGELANWNTPRPDDVRNLNGRISFFATWDRALSRKEIKKNYQLVRPRKPIQQ